MAIVILCQSDLDLAHEHTMTFSNREEQFDYLKGNYFRTIRNMNIPVDGDREYFEVDANINEVIEYDYCIITNGLGDTYYYFIVDMEQKGMLTNIYVQVDLIQTYLFDWEIRESFIDRMHVDRWQENGLPTPNYEDEGLDYGTSVIEEIEKIINIPLNYVICATTPIGKIDTDNGGDGGDGGGTTGGDWKNGVPSSSLYRFLKGFEGFAPNLYRDSGGVPTIGYGITASEPTEFNKLKSNQPCSEELCAKTGWDVLKRKYAKPIVNSVKNLGCDKQRQFDALLDLAYNGGTDLVINSSGNRELVNTIKKDPNNESAIRPVWERYIINDANGVPQPGLVARRKAECNMYFGKKYEIRPIGIIGTNGNVTGTFKGDGWLP